MSSILNLLPTQGLSPDELCDSRAIFVNGPPRSGKDTVAQMVRDYCFFHGMSCSLMKMAGPIRGALEEAFGNLVTFEGDEKERTIPMTGMSTRQMMISFSEQWMKPSFGRDIFGRLAAHRILRSLAPRDAYVFSDAGFQEEMVPVLSLFTKPALLIRLTRPGTSFEGDSRSYVSYEPCVTIDNDGTRADLQDRVWEVLRDVL